MIELVVVVEDVKKLEKLVEELLEEKLIVSPFIQQSYAFRNNTEYKLIALTRAFLYKEIDEFIKSKCEDVLIYSKPIIDMDFAHSQKLLKSIKAV